jgi:hypothetical protein
MHPPNHHYKARTVKSIFAPNGFIAMFLVLGSVAFLLFLLATNTILGPKKDQPETYILMCVPYIGHLFEVLMGATYNFWS